MPVIKPCTAISQTYLVNMVMKLQYLWIDFENESILNLSNKHKLFELHET